MDTHIFTHAHTHTVELNENPQPWSHVHARRQTTHTYIHTHTRTAHTTPTHTTAYMRAHKKIQLDTHTYTHTYTRRIQPTASIKQRKVTALQHLCKPWAPHSHTAAPNWFCIHRSVIHITAIFPRCFSVRGHSTRLAASMPTAKAGATNAWRHSIRLTARRAALWGQLSQHKRDTPGWKRQAFCDHSTAVDQSRDRGSSQQLRL